jgi:hypothetical protein
LVFIRGENGVLSLMLILLVVFVVLSLLLAAWTIFFQGYIYSEPVEAIYWRAPAAGAALTLFLCIWVVCDYRSVHERAEEGRYRPLHEFSAHETETYEHIAIVNRDRKEEHFVRQGDNKYRNKSGKEPPQRPLKIIANHPDGEKHIFVPVEKDGRLRYYEEGNPSRYMEEAYIGQISSFRFGLLAATLLLNFGFLLVWFVCLWLLLRFQWAHALGLAFGFWLVSLFILPMILTQAEKVRKERLPPATTSQTAEPSLHLLLTHTAA